MKTKSKNQAFTLVELLTTIAIVAILGTILVTAVGKVRETAYKASDLSASRQLISAYLMYAQDNDGMLLPSNPDPIEKNTKTIYDHNGDPVHLGINYERFVFRLLPYTGGIDAFYPGRSQALLNEIRDDPYQVALSPSFGLNIDFMGADLDQYSPKYYLYRPNLKLTHLSKSQNPSQQVVFASSFHIDEAFTDVVEYVGLVGVTAPYTWSGSYTPNIPGNTGNVHFRYNGQAVVANLDGHVELLDEEQLKDMRRWSNEAQMAGSAGIDFKPSRR